MVKDIPSCHLCGYDINKYFSSVFIGMCQNCQVLYCKNCSKSLKGGKCNICKKKILRIKKPKENPFQISARPQKELKREVNKKVSKKDQKHIEIENKYSGDFTQSGVICRACKTVSPFRNKRCINCKQKLKINPLTTVYFNGNVQAVQCRKCGLYTGVKLLSCEHCGKKIKI